MTTSWDNPFEPTQLTSMSKAAADNLITSPIIPDVTDNATATYYYPYNRNVEVTNKVVTFITVCAPILVVTGTVTNVVAIVTAIKSAALRECPVNLYILVLAILDTVLMDLGLLDLILYVQGTEVRIMSSDACRAVVCILFFLRIWDVWIMVNMCLEGLIFVFMPHLALRLFDKQKIGVSLALMGVSSIALSLVYAATLERKGMADTGQNVCSPMPKYQSFYKQWFWVDWSLTMIVPIAAMATFVIAITTHRVYVIINKKKLQVTQNTQISSLTITFLAIAVLYCLTTIPLAVLQAVLFGQSSRQDLQISNLFNAYIFMDFFWYLNCAMHWYIYLACSKKYRTETKAMVMWILRKSGKMTSSQGGVAQTATGVRLSVYRKTVNTETNGSSSTVA